VNIGILTVTDPALRKLQADQPSGREAGAVGSEGAEAAKSVAPAKPRPTGNMAPSVKFPSLRAALDARISADVSSGTLSQSDAVTVKQTLDEIDNRSTPAHRPQAARAYLATIGRGTLIDRFG
jgi:hypothetical protein